MGYKSINHMISRMCWALSLWLSLALEPSEREAAVGDLVESGESGIVALRAVSGLALRRQAAVWEEWRMWLLFATVLLPLSFSLCFVSQAAAHETAVYTWMYANNWDWNLAKNSGFWYVFREAAMRLCLSLLTIASWSWSTGFVMGILRRKILLTSRTLLFLLLALFQLGNLPQRFLLFLMNRFAPPKLPILPDSNAPLTAITVYDLIFPWIILAIFVVLPAILGIADGEKSSSLNLSLRVGLLMGAVLATLTILPQVPGFGLLLGASGREWIWQHQRAARLLSLTIYWPFVYIIGVRVMRYGRDKAVLA
ncbi:MAG TPA: hypothetical protein VJS37_15475 [Terriglobales bacterium]|nr:hypothetical protein [Terriglobales bacterium]